MKVQLQAPFRRQTVDSTCEISICEYKRRSGDTQSTAHADLPRIHESISNPDVNTHRPMGSAILRRHELRRERGLRVAQGYWLSTVRRGHRRAVRRLTALTRAGCDVLPLAHRGGTGRGWCTLLHCSSLGSANRKLLSSAGPATKAMYTVRQGRAPRGS